MKSFSEKMELVNKISNPVIVYKKIKEIYPCDSEIRVSTRKDKKYMIYNPNTCKWFHFGSSNYSDFTRHGDLQRRKNFLIRNQRWAEADIYTPAYASYYILWK